MLANDRIRFYKKYSIRGVMENVTPITIVWSTAIKQDNVINVSTISVFYTVLIAGGTTFIVKANHAL